MKLVKNMRWAAIALGVLGGSVNALACTVTPDSILTEGQTLQLVADCTNGAANDRVNVINWKMAVGTAAAVTVTGDVTLAQGSAKKIYFTTPVGLTSAGTGEYTFSVSGTYIGGAPLTTADPATVVVKPASAAVALALGVNPVTPVNASCGTTPGTALQNMPTGTAQCSVGSKAALAISGPESFTWSCLSQTGGAEANCYGVRGFTVTATDNGSPNGDISPASQGVASGGTVSISASPANGYSAAISSGCGGTQSGNNFTTGPVTANCTVTASFTNAPVNGACGSASNTSLVTTAPSANLCSAGSNTSVASGATAYTWGCNGSNTGTSTSATACQAPRGYDVATTVSGSNGTISAGKVVAGGTTTTFTVSPASGYAATVTGSCGGSLSGTTFTTGAITAACTVTASFAVQTVSTTDTGIGSGLWVPPGTTGRLIADQSGAAASLVSYVPGCLNGNNITTNSASGCGADAFYTGTVSGTSTSTTFAFGPGKVLGLRYKSKANAGSTVKYFLLSSGDGGNTGQMKVWLSDNPAATYAETPVACKSESTAQPYAATGPGYCQITGNKLYYLLMSTDREGTNFRYQVSESTADFD